MRPYRHPGSRFARIGACTTGVLLAGGVTAFAFSSPAYAGTTGTGSTGASLSSGSLAVTAVGTQTTLSGTVAAQNITGDLPSVTLQDTTGLGLGWNATVGVSDLTYTGTWAPVGSATALTTDTSGAFTGAVDGVTYTVTTGAIAAGVGTFTYTSTDSADPSGSGSAAADTNEAVGTQGLTINFGTQTIATNTEYRIHVGTQSSTALSLDTAASGAGVTTTDGNTPPTLANNGSSLPGGGVGSASYGTAVQFVSAAVDDGMGTYVVTPGVEFASDVTSWAATYSAGLQYSIVSGP